MRYPKLAPLSRFITTFCRLLPPAWIAAGLLDYLWHRKTRIDTTTGPQESWLHLLMLTEAAPIALAPLLFEINAGVLVLIASAFLAHEATAAWDVSMTAPRRVIETTEQHIHSVLEMMPFSVASLYVVSHWDKLQAIFHPPHTDDFRLRLKQPRASAAQVVGLCAAITLFDFLPHVEELWRCRVARQKGLTGRDSPEYAAVLYGEKTRLRVTCNHLPCRASSGAARSTGSPECLHASNPPSSGRTRVNPALFSCSATRALVASLGQVQ